MNDPQKPAAAPDAADESHLIRLERDHSAIILNGDGDIIEARIPAGEYVPRGGMIVSLLMIMPRERLDALILEYFPSEKPD